MTPDLGTRFELNPLITPADVRPSRSDLVVECVMNPGVFTFDKKTWLIVRVAERPLQDHAKVSFPILDGNGGLKIIEYRRDDPALDMSDPRHVQYNGQLYLSTISHLRLFCSADGVHFEEPADYDTRLFGMGNNENYGIEDCRVTEISGTYYLTYSEVSANGVGVGLMQTRDWQTIERHGMIFPPHNKDCAIFDEKIDGKYYCLSRPSGLAPGGHFMWISASPDLKHWGAHECILQPREGMWDSARVGAGAAPIKTPRGWLAIYHGADEAHRYRLGAILLDLENPVKVIARTSQPIMEPQESYEKEGFFNNVIFTNGHLVRDDKVIVYYGACDMVVCGVTFSISEIMDQLLPV